MSSIEDVEKYPMADYLAYREAAIGKGDAYLNLRDWRAWQKAGRPIVTADLLAADPRDAEIVELKKQVDQHLTDALVRAYRLTIAIEALKKIRDAVELPMGKRLIAATALRQIEEVQP